MWSIEMYPTSIILILGAGGLSSMFTQKIDVLDMIIEVLREHEKELDRLIQRLENVKILT